jgi:hypothetical protein
MELQMRVKDQVQLSVKNQKGLAVPLREGKAQEEAPKGITSLK